MFLVSFLYKGHESVLALQLHLLQPLELPWFQHGENETHGVLDYRKNKCILLKNIYIIWHSIGNIWLSYLWNLFPCLRRPVTED